MDTQLQPRMFQSQDPAQRISGHRLDRFDQHRHQWITARMKAKSQQTESAALAAALENNGICPAQAKMMAKTETFLQRIGMASPGSRPVHHITTDGLGKKSLNSFNVDTAADSNLPQLENGDGSKVI